MSNWTGFCYQKLSSNYAGVIGEDEKVELIAGDLVTEGMADRMAQKSLHAWLVTGVAETLGEAFGAGYHIRQQLPISLGTNSDPELDDAVVPGSRQDYKTVHPTTSVLIVEVSDTTLRFDRSFKASLYASTGVLDYWIINVPETRLEVYRNPVQDDSQPFAYRYEKVTVFGAGDYVASLILPDTRIAVTSLLP